MNEPPPPIVNLVNAAGVCTPHKYLRSERSEVAREGGHPITGTAHIYECTKTGAERKWGFDR